MITEDKVREVTLYSKTGEKKEGQWSVIKQNKILIDKKTTIVEIMIKKSIDIVSDGYYEITAKYRRKVEANLDGEVIFGDYEEISEAKEIKFFKFEHNENSEKEDDNKDNFINHKSSFARGILTMPL